MLGVFKFIYKSKKNKIKRNIFFSKISMKIGLFFSRLGVYFIKLSASIFSLSKRNNISSRGKDK